MLWCREDRHNDMPIEINDDVIFANGKGRIDPFVENFKPKCYAENYLKYRDIADKYFGGNNVATKMLHQIAFFAHENQNTNFAGLFNENYGYALIKCFAVKNKWEIDHPHMWNEYPSRTKDIENYTMEQISNSERIFKFKNENEILETDLHVILLNFN